MMTDRRGWASPTGGSIYGHTEVSRRLVPNTRVVAWPDAPVVRSLGGRDPLRECGEQLVDLREHGGLLVDLRKQDSMGAWAHLRAGVLRRLLIAQETLPAGVRLLVIEGHRPLATCTFRL